MLAINKYILSYNIKRNKTPLLSFRELEFSSCFFTSWFLSFYHSWITGKETFFFQWGPVFCIKFTKCPRNGHADGFCLSLDAATVNIDFDVINITFVDKA